MSNQRDSFGSRFRNWLGINYDYLFALREQTDAAFGQMMGRIRDFAKPSRSRKPKATYPLRVEELEIRQMPATFGFAASNYATSEQIGYATVSIDRSDSSGVASVYVADTSGTAVNGTDYKFTPQAISFANGQSQASVSVQIIDEGIYQTDAFSLTLSNPSSPYGLDSGLTTTTMTILPVTWNNPADITYGTVLSNTQLDATAEVGGGFSYTPDTSALLDAGANQTLSVTFTPTDASYAPITQTVSINVNQATLTVTGITASDKVYDGGTVAGLDVTNAALVGAVSGDPVILNSDSAAGTFASQDVGSAIGVQVSGLTLDNNSLGDYTLAQPDATADITPATLTVTGITASDKVYDGGTVAGLDVTNAALVGAVSGDPVILNSDSAAGTFASQDVGSAIGVQVSGLTLDNNSLGDYTLAQPDATADITPATLTVTGITASDKVYDGGTVAGLDVTNAALVGAVSGDPVTLNSDSAAGTFASQDVGSATGVQVSGLTLDNNSLGDYTLAQPDATADITPATLTISAESLAKIYGTTVAFAGTEFTTNGLVTGDSVTNVTMTCADEAASSSAVNSPYDIVASDAQGTGLTNYAVTYVNGTLIVNKAQLTVVADDQYKTYDGQVFAPFTILYTGFVNDDDAAIVAIAGTPDFSGSATTATTVGTYSIHLNSVADLSAGNYGFTASTSDATLTIARATPTIIVSGGGPYTGAPMPVTALIMGVAAGIDDTPAPTLEGAGLNVIYYAGTDASGIPLWTAPTLPGTYTVDVRFPGSADYISAENKFTFSIYFDGPQTLNPGNQTTTFGSSVLLPIHASDSDGDILTYAANNLPPGLSINYLTGVISGVVVPGTLTGVYSVTVAAFDELVPPSFPWPNSQDFTWTIVTAAPIANVANYSVLHDQALWVSATSGLLVGNSGFGTPVIVNGPSQGSITLYGDGSFLYIPNLHFTGADSFTYHVVTPQGVSNVATVRLQVTNSAPLGEADVFGVQAGSGLSGGVLSNDIDPDGDYLTAVLTSTPSNGTIVFYPTGNFYYSPNTGFVGTDTFTYQASDGIALSTPTLVTINVMNSPPIASSDAFSTHAGNTLTVGNPYYSGQTGVLTDDQDPEGNLLSAILVSGPTFGTLTLHTNGWFTYIPNAGFVGTDSFTYQASDGMASSNVATVTINVTNTAPVAVADGYTLQAGQTLTGGYPYGWWMTGVLSNDTDVDGDVLTASLVSGANHGTLTLNTNGFFTYTPNAGFTGIDSFTYQDSDGYASSNIATVTLNVFASIPIARNDVYTVHAGSTFTAGVSWYYWANGVLSNDNDPDGQALTPSLVSGPTNGSLTFNSNGSFQYVPDSGFLGSDSFTYQASNGISQSNIATVTLDVIDTAPVATAGAFLARPNSSFYSSMLNLASDIDGDALTPSIVSSTTNGIVTLSSNGMFSYTPNVGFVGSDSFTYQVTDGTLTSNVATISIAVTNTAPLAEPWIFRAPPTPRPNPLSLSPPPENPGLNASLTAVDADGDALTYAVASDVSQGTLTLNANGSLKYVPAEGYVGSDSFTYQVRDQVALSNVATVTLITGDAAPTGYAQSYTVHADQAFYSASSDDLPSVLSTAVNPSDGYLTADLLSRPSNGALQFNADGTFEYTPNPGFLGQDSFIIEVDDGVETSAPITETVTVTDTAPTALPDTFVVSTNPTPNPDDPSPLAPQSFNLYVLGNDTDPDGDPLTPVNVSSPNHGTLTLNNDGSYAYTPNIGFVGTDSFSYKANDGALMSAPVTVTIFVGIQPPTPPPLAVNDAYTLNPTTVNPWNNPISGNVQSNDTFTGTTVQLSNVTNGTLTLDGYGNFTYTPNPGFFGTDGFSYENQSTDGNGNTIDSNIATVTIIVANPATGPGTAKVVARNAQYTMVHDQFMTQTAQQGVVSRSNITASGTTFASLVSNVQDGTLNLLPSGAFSYMPDVGFVGTDSFQYKVNNSNTARISLIVKDTPPVATDDTYTDTHDIPLSVPVSAGVLNNDSDPDGDPMTAVLVTGPGHGTLTLDPSGSFTYTPAAGFVGGDGFIYQAYDGILYGNKVLVTITVQNSPPVARSDSFTLSHDETLSLPLTAGLSGDVTDTDLVTFSLVQGPSYGNLTLNPSGAFSYSPNAGFVGTDSFLYQANDGAFASNVALVTLQVTDSAPLASDYSFTTVHDMALSIDPGSGLLAGDIDPEGDPITLTLVNNVANGALVLNPQGSFTYTPNPGYVGPDQFTYQLSDGLRLSRIATVSISVTRAVITWVAHVPAIALCRFSLVTACGFVAHSVRPPPCLA